jgi:integrase/recombinase XerC
MRIEHFIQNWISWLSHVRRYSPHTIEAYRHDLLSYLSFHQIHRGEVPSLTTLTSLTPSEFRAWMAYRLKNHFSVRSTARAVSVMRSFYTFLSRESDEKIACLSFMRSPKVKIGLPRPLSIQDTLKLLSDMAETPETMELNACTDPWVSLRNRAFFTLLYATGMRISEGLSLKQSCLPLGDSLIIQGKGSKERVIPILEEVRTCLADYITACPWALGPQDALFVGVRGGPLHPHVAQKIMRDYRRRVGLPETITPHSLRHSCATHLLANEGDLRSIQELLGHASLKSTQIYTNVDQTQLMKTFRAAHPRSNTTEKPRDLR